MIYKPLGFYHDFQMQVLEKYKTLEPLDALDILTAPENIRKNLKSENDIYKFEYCSGIIVIVQINPRFQDVVQSRHSLRIIPCLLYTSTQHYTKDNGFGLYDPSLEVSLPEITQDKGFNVKKAFERCV